jgi:hypothetical protein
MNEAKKRNIEKNLDFLRHATHHNKIQKHDHLKLKLTKNER